MKRLLAFLLLIPICGAANAAPITRSIQRFDAGWRFIRGHAPNAFTSGFNDSHWRTIELPHDYSIEDLPSVGGANAPTIALTPGVWRFRAGDDLAWKAAKLDDSSWREVYLPINWEEIGQSTASNVYGWYRRPLYTPADARGKDVVILIGKVDDVDETFVNGVKVGGMGTFPPKYATAYDSSRRYLVPAKLLKYDGTDVVAVRCFDGEGYGGINAGATLPTRHGPFDSGAVGGSSQGYTLGDIAWYRKTFMLPEAQRGKRFSITFDGVYMNSEVWLNGKPIGRNPYGYTSFNFELTPYLRFGKQPNVIAVKVDSTGRTSRWYSGSGIYRHVWLTATNPVHIANWGVFVTTPRVSAASATVRIRTSVVNEVKPSGSITVTSRIVGPTGVVATISTGGVKAMPTKELEQSVTFARPKLWSPDSPTLYKLVSTLSVDNKPVDVVVTPVGIRSVSIDAKRGLLLNGNPPMAATSAGACITTTARSVHVPMIAQRNVAYSFSKLPVSTPSEPAITRLRPHF